MKILLITLLSFFSMSISDCGNQVAADPCFTEREVTAEIENIDLKCLRTGEQNILENVSSKARYSVCNSASHTMEEGKSYVVSGKVYEIKPNERWPGTPLEITKVKQ